MERFYYYQKRTQEHQREISKELATRNTLREAKWNAPRERTGRRIALIASPILIGFLIWVLMLVR